MVFCIAMMAKSFQKFDINNENVAMGLKNEITNSSNDHFEVLKVIKREKKATGKTIYNIYSSTGSIKKTQICSKKNNGNCARIIYRY